MALWTVLRPRRQPGLIPLAEALEALGHVGEAGLRTTDVDVNDIVGSEARSADFDRHFRPARGASRERYERWVRASDAGVEPPPVDLLQLGELYFVRDGHHRIAALTARGRRWVTARVRRICTIAYAQCCLHAVDLPAKAADRRLLERDWGPDELRFLRSRCPPPGT